MLKTFSKRFTSNLRWEVGKFPKSLNFNREIELSTLKNGVRVASQYWDGPVATIGIMIEAGSRNETLHNSGVAHYLEHMHFKGTKKRTKDQLEIEVESMGGALNAFTSRDTTLFFIEVLKESCSNALDIISDQLLNSTYLDEYISQERHTILREEEEVAKDMRETLLENLHNVVFRNHILGQPILGYTRSIKKINKMQLKKFIETHYLAPKIVVLGVGNIQHEQLMSMANTFIGNVPSTSLNDRDGEHSAVYTPGIVVTKDESAEFSHFSLFMPAPNWNDSDYWAFLLLQRIVGDYSSAKIMRIDDPSFQNNKVYKDLDLVGGVKRHECLYIPYKDVGVFGHYLSVVHENAHLAANALYRSFFHFVEDLEDTEVICGKNRIFNELLNIELGSDITQTIGAQLIYLNRLVPRSEIAKRVADYDAEGLKKIFKKYCTKDNAAVAIKAPKRVIKKSLEKLSKS
jgi:hypothetical protein